MRRQLAAAGGTLVVCALLGIAAPATAVGADCADEDLLPAAGNLERVEAAVLCTLNRERAAVNLAPLRRAAKLDLSARFHTLTMVRRRMVGHELPDHPSLLSRVRGFGYFAGALTGIYAENVGVGPTTNGTARAMTDGWMGSPTHRANVLHAAFRDVGIAAQPAPPHPAFFADFPSTVYTTDFGTRYERRAAPRRRCVRRRTSTSRRTGSATPRSRYCARRR